MPQVAATHPAPAAAGAGVPSEAGVAPQNPTAPHTPAASVPNMPAPYTPASLPTPPGGIHSKYSETFILFLDSLSCSQYFICPFFFFWFKQQFHSKVVCFSPRQPSESVANAAATAGSCCCACFPRPAQFTDGSAATTTAADDGGAHEETTRSC